jgi:hypothetical protein
MSLSLAIAVILVADVLLTALLAYAMTRAGKLTPHVSVQAQQPARRSEPKRAPRPQRTARSSRRPQRSGAAVGS